MIVVAQTFTCFLISGSSLQNSPNDGACCGHSFSGCHRNAGPIIHRLCATRVWAPIPREASSAGFSLVSTYFHCLGLEKLRMVCTRFATKTWKRFWSFPMYPRTVVESVWYWIVLHVSSSSFFRTSPRRTERVAAVARYRYRDLHCHKDVDTPLNHSPPYLRLRRCESVWILFLRSLLVSHNEERPYVRAVVFRFATFPSICSKLQAIHHPSQAFPLYRDLEVVFFRR